MKSKQYPYEVYVLRKRVNLSSESGHCTQARQSTESVRVGKCSRTSPKGVNTIQGKTNLVWSRVVIKGIRSLRSLRILDAVSFPYLSSALDSDFEERPLHAKLWSLISTTKKYIKFCIATLKDCNSDLSP